MAAEKIIKTTASFTGITSRRCHGRAWTGCFAWCFQELAGEFPTQKLTNTWCPFKLQQLKRAKDLTNLDR